MKEKIFSIEDLENLGHVLKEKRIEKGLSMYGLAKETGGAINISHIMRYERGENTSMNTFMQVIKVLYDEE
jgi:transcriptional regulator with XRE-family HTH domain